MGGQYSSKRESFHDAILKKDLKKVKYFIQNGLDVKNDLRALELATYRGSTDIVEYLLHRGCKPNNKRTARAFDIAVWKCHKEIAQLFLKAGIEYKGKNIYQETILFVAACSNNTALTEILIESGCDMNETTRCWAPLHAAAARNHEQTLETLLKHGCSVNIKDKDGFTALAYCIRNENIKCIQILIKCGCKIDMTMINSTESLRTQLIKYPLIEQLLYQELTRVKSLKELARLRIRKSLDQRLLSKVNSLPLPLKLKDYISMKEIFGTTTSKTNTVSSLINENPTNLDSNNVNDDNKGTNLNINKSNSISSPSASSALFSSSSSSSSSTTSSTSSDTNSSHSSSSLPDKTNKEDNLINSVEKTKISNKDLFQIETLESSSVASAESPPLSSSYFSSSKTNQKIQNQQQQQNQSQQLITLQHSKSLSSSFSKSFIQCASKKFKLNTNKLNF